MTTRFTVLVLCGMLVGCHSITTTQTGSKYPPRPADCKFTMLAKSPKGGFAEIGAIKVNGATGGGSLADFLRFKNDIRSHVCRAGGDAVVAVTSESGVFVGATIWKQNETPTPKGIAKAPAAPVSASARAADAGCHEDEQCQGDLVCVDGKCAQPPASAAPLEPEPEVPAAQDEGELSTAP